jgi:NADP-dependent 3-hydroxy acid dehydrogenase YdfG
VTLHVSYSITSPRAATKHFQHAFPIQDVLIIGATSGIGHSVAEKIIANGSHVIALGRQKENLDALAKKHGSDKISTVQFDITDLNGIPAMVDR